MLITCFSKDMTVSDYNINLFKQSDITCNQQDDDSVYLNSSQCTLNKSTLLFFAACTEDVYTYLNHNHANIFNLKSNLIICYISVSHKALL